MFSLREESGAPEEPSPGSEHNLHTFPFFSSLRRGMTPAWERHTLAGDLTGKFAACVLSHRRSVCLGSLTAVSRISLCH